MEKLDQLLEGITYLLERDAMEEDIIKDMHDIMVKQAYKVSFLEQRIERLEKLITKED